MKLKAVEEVIPKISIENLADEKLGVILRIQTAVLQAMVKKLIERGFSWVLPVMLSKSTDPLWPDSASSIEKRITLEIYGKQVKTMQSMILHKRALVSLGTEKFFILSPNIRIEARERAGTGWHLYEFTQLDLEAAYWRMQKAFRLFEDLIEESLSTLRENYSKELSFLGRNLPTFKIPFKTYQRSELEKKYGKRWEEVVSKKEVNPIWVTDLPREFYDYKEKDSGAWRNFDLILPEGFGEVISGAEREYEYKKILEKIKKDGLNPKDYEALLKLAKGNKLKPSCGAGLGVERLIAYLCGVQHIAKVQPFPRIPGIVPEL